MSLFNEVQALDFGKGPDSRLELLRTERENLVTSIVGWEETLSLSLSGCSSCVDTGGLKDAQLGL